MNQAKCELIDLLDEVNLPLKNRMDDQGDYSPKRERAAQSRTIQSLIPTEPLEDCEQYRFHFDMSRCVGCQCCVVACNEQNNNPAHVNWRRVGEIEGGTYPDTKKYHLSMACNHCLDPSCLTGCPTDAYIKLENGVVKQQAEACIGCGYCTWNCPYGVPQYNPERNIVTKCDMCHSRLSHGEVPACVEACPQGAIQIEKVNIEEWRKDHVQAEAPYVPDSNMTISTTRMTLPKEMPEEMLKADRHRLEPEDPHTPLIFMTVLTQLAAGGLLTLWLGNLFSHFLLFLKPLQDFLAYGAVGMLIAAGIALLAAIFHLGRPLYAFKALKMWRRSWLSREVLLFSLFSCFGAAYAGLLLLDHSWKLSIPEWWMSAAGGMIVFLGLAGVLTSAKIYLVPARPSWNTSRTPLKFFLTGFVLGPLFALLVYAFYVMAEAPAVVSPSFQGPACMFLSVSACAGLLQLAVLLSRLFHLRDSESDELYGSTFLLIHRFKGFFLTRIVLLFLGSFVLPFCLFHFLSLGSLSRVGFVGFAMVCFGFSLLGELLGRYLFFVTVVPKNIPGSFFALHGGRH